MKQLFSIGDPVTPSDNKPWIPVNRPDTFYGQLPKFGDIYHVSLYSFDEKGGLISLEEFSQSYRFRDTRFSPVIPTSVLESELEQLNKVTV